MTSLINPVIHAALSDLCAAVQTASPPDLAEMERRLARIRAQIVLFRCAASLRLHDIYLELIRLEVSDLNAGFEAEQRGRIALGGPAPTLRAGLQAAANACADDRDRALYRESLLEIEALVGPVAVAARASALPGAIGPIKPGGLPGISLVTCAMNRSENLLRALPSWLAQDAIAEVLIVDWSSDAPVAESLAAAGITDRRIRILRVEGEPRWVLTYAFNLGFRAARFDTILKADADITLSSDFFRRNPLAPGAMIAGNWREATPDQPHVNGFFYVQRGALAQVGGFNEHITTYGWDDEDLYTRLVVAGLRRVNVAPGTIFHLPHSDAVRTGEPSGDVPTFPAAILPARETLARNTQFLIRRNRFLVASMPDWDASAPLVPFDALGFSANGLRLKRGDHLPSAVPANVNEAANLHVSREMLSWRLGREVLALDGPALAAVLARPEADIGLVDVALAKVLPDRVRRGPGRYLAIDATGAIKADQAAALPKLIERARGLGLEPVLRVARRNSPLPPDLAEMAVLTGVELARPNAEVTTEMLLSGEVTRGCDLVLDIASADLAGIASAAPVVIRPRGRVYIDAQHGLGNRLRAIASAAVIAEAEGSELVIIWQPDDHCDCRFSDLFDYPGAVMEERFLDDARRRGWQVLNYMAAEPEAAKDAAVRMGLGRDIYARSAFVLNAPVSTWAAENAVLRALTPVPAVRDLVAGVRHPNDIAVHVRMQGGAAHEHLPYERPDNWLPEDHAAIAQWRARSHFAHFLRRIEAMTAAGVAQTLFLAADLPETYTVFQDHFGDRVAWLARDRYDRSAEQLQYGLADALLLGRAPRLLGSTWSSFSELAMRLAPREQVVEMSGTDF